MEFCGRCGKELGRGLERGRFCAACGHESPGNARYPLYADGVTAATSASGTATAVTLPRVADTDLTSVRLPSVPAVSAPVTVADPSSAWRTTLLAGLLVMLAVVLLGGFLLFH